jgi:type IV secretory pathway TraG/TraD family ATPase VirD4
MGKPRTGKSTAIRNALGQIRERREPAIIIDPEGEYTREFFDEREGDVIWNPLDLRCRPWKPRSELRDEFFAVDAAAMAASLIRGNPRADNERFFLTSTRTVIEAIFEKTRDSGEVEDLLKFVAMERGKLHEALKGTPAYPLIDPEAHDQGAGILGTAANAIKTFVHLPKYDGTIEPWSAREWVQHRRGCIFLPSRSDIHQAIELLQGLMFDCLIRWLMMPNTEGVHTWIIADELASLGYQPNIETLLARGGKRWLPVILAFQNVSQLKRHYGEEGAVTLVSLPATKLILRIEEPKTTEWLSKLIGSHEVERLTMTQVAAGSKSKGREGVNLQPQRSIEPLVLPDEIGLLPKFTGYLCVSGYNRTMVRIPRQDLLRQRPDFIPRLKIEPLAEIDDITDDQILDQMKAQAARS